MSYSKAVVDFSDYADGALSAPAHKIHQTMLITNVATFPSAPFTAVAFFALVDDWDTKLGESLKGGTDRTNLKNDARNALEDALNQLGTFVNLKAQGSQAMIDLSGFPSYTTDRVQSQGGVAFIPQNVRWEDGTISGEGVLRWKGDGTHAMYEVQTCTGDPNQEANWSYKGSFSGGRALLKNLAPGTKIWGRVRKIGTKGEVGGWSDPAQMTAS